MTPTDKQRWLGRIAAMSHIQLATLQRCGPTCIPQCPIFNGRKHGLYKYFRARLAECGGMTEEIQEELGW